jgi:MFS family permease
MPVNSGGPYDVPFLTFTRDRPIASRLTRNSNFLLLVVGQFVSQMGDRLAMVAFPWLVFRTTESALSTGIVLALFTLPYVIFGTIAGGVLDRVDKRGVMVAADIARGGLVLAVPFVASRTTGGLFALTFATATATVFFAPGLMALLPDIVSEEELLRANSVLAASEHIAEIVGFSAAGFLVHYLAMRTVFTVDAATFAASAVTLLAMTVQSSSKRDSALPPNTSRRTKFSSEIAEGVRYLRQHVGLRANTALAIAAATGAGAFYPLTFLLAADRFGGTTAFGFMEASLAVGYLCASVVIGAMGGRVRKGLAITIGLMVMGALAALPWAIHTLPVVLLDFMAMGAANAAVLISIDTYVQTAVPARLRGRVWGARFTLTQGAFAIGVLVAGALVAGLGLGPLFGVCGAVLFVPALIGLFLPVVRDV